MNTKIRDYKIAFIGPGVMAEAMIAGLLREKLTTPDKLLASGPRVGRGDQLRDKYGITPLTDNAEAARNADVVVLSIKPQRLGRVLEDMKGAVSPTTLVLSIVAGAPMSKIADALGSSGIVRAMPNTPGRIGVGISVWTALPGTTEEQRELARQILMAMGEEIFMDEESFLDKATALSGTGPAYVYLFMEAMVDAGVHLGFPRRVAEKLVSQTLRGSVDYYRDRDDPVHLARLRNRVTSPGGTSAAALYYLEKAGFRTAISRAIWAAYERSLELGRDAQSRPPE
jgi:pyrroline-5-carboxylate reductase